MGRVYVLTKPEGEVIPRLQAGAIPGLEYCQAEGENAKYWPHGVTDGRNYGWFESNMLLFWGSNDETPILKSLGQHGIKVIDTF